MHTTFVSAQTQMPEPPRAAQKLHKLTKHKDTRIDPYFWMKERESPEVVKYLEAENKYMEDVFGGQTQKLQDTLFEEMKSRIKKDDSSVPIPFGDYFYYTRYEGTGEYPFYCRKKGSLQAKEEIIFDVGAMAKNQDYYSFDGVKVADDQNLAAFSVDTQGRRFYDIGFKNLKTGEILSQKISQTTGDMEWASDGKTLFYIKQDPQTLRAHQLYRYSIDTQKSDLVYEEKDETFRISIAKDKSRTFLILDSSSTLTSEARVLKASDPLGKFQIFQKRERGHEYAIDWAGDRFYILTNSKAKNFKIMEAQPSKTQKKYWKPVIAHDPKVLIEGFDPFQNFLTLQVRRDGLTELRVMDRKNKKIHTVKLPEKVSVSYLMDFPKFDSDSMRFGYQSMITPASVYDYDMRVKKMDLKKRQEVPGYDLSKYETDRIWIKARDGTKVPVSFVHKKGVQKNSKNPVLLYGYGSYGYSVEPYFSSASLSLVDRGFIFARAHIRGGSELGRHWYEDGKLLKKKNTFNDFIDAGRALIKLKYTSTQHLYAMGGSAGGLLMGAVINQAPDLFHGVVAAVPFVDVVTTMLDDSIPLTTSEYDEWGNPNDKRYYNYIKSYSPYDNVEPKSYPNLLVLTGFHDSQVQYWEPAKWVAKLRATKKDQNLLIFKTDMDAGHSGTTGRFKALKDTALEYTFLLHLEGHQSN